jgi:hypothetical protein
MPEENKIYAVEDVEDLLAEFNSPRNRLTVFKPFVRYFGDLNTAIILSEIFTWSYHFRHRKLPGIGYGWFYRQYEPSCKSQELDGTPCVEIPDDETHETVGRESEGKTWLERVGLREDVVRKIVKALVKDGYIQTMVKKANGAPTCHYKFVRGKLLELMDTLKKQERNPEKYRERTQKKTGKETSKKQESLTEETPDITHKTTTEEIRLLFSGTPLFEISDKGLIVLIKRHGIERLLVVADIAAETWRRERKEIHNPGGYLQTLCESHVAPDWYATPEERNAKIARTEEWIRSEAKEKEEIRAAEEKEARAREVLWMSLSESERQKYRDEIKASSPLFLNLSDERIDVIVKLNAWDQRLQMDTNGTCSR